MNLSRYYDRKNKMDLLILSIGDIEKSEIT